ncbi:MAG: tetratricopeptide repeat protein [Candidatus Omnitrophica bacterium]|nr:tetratricopeptide repeat protein [Candidatus Omnitrophota bacterium]MCK5493677.1 tetratricopeptide repeat protein [Candidatus Omnitrophota bacterium]
MKFLLILFLIFIPIFYSQAENLSDQEARLYREEGYKLQQSGDLEGALAYYQKAVQMSPNYIEVLNDLGVVYEALGKDSEAIKIYKKVLDLDAKFLPAYSNLAFVYERLHDNKNAVKYWQKRYELGNKGDYWWQVSRDHLVKLGSSSPLKEELLLKKVESLSDELVSQKQIKKEKIKELVRFHFELGSKAFHKGDYLKAINAFAVVLSYDNIDEEIRTKSLSFYEQAEVYYIKNEALVNTTNALKYIKKSDYTSAEKRLQKAISAVSKITKKK